MLTFPHITVDRVTLAHGEHVVFDSFSLSIHERRVGLIGANGSGKSSLVRLAHGLALPMHGTVTAVGLNTATQRKQIPPRVGFLFQNPDRQIIFPTVGEEVAFGFQKRGDTRREAMRQALVWLTRFGRAERAAMEKSVTRALQQMAGHDVVDASTSAFMRLLAQI